MLFRSSTNCSARPSRFLNSLRSPVETTRTSALDSSTGKGSTSLTSWSVGFSTTSTPLTFATSKASEAKPLTGATDSTSIPRTCDRTGRLTMGLSAILNHRSGREEVYAVAERFVEEALKSDGSLFTPGTAIWSAENIEDLYERFVGNPDESSDRFEDKFRRQLEGAPLETRQLAAELLYIHLLFP